MKKLNNSQLLSIKGGGIAWTTWGLIGGGIIFIIGVIDGFVRPLRCN